MKHWQKFVLYPILWVAAVIAVAFLHTEIFLAGRLTPQQDYAISYNYGQICGVGIIGICVFLFTTRQQSR